MLSSDEHLVYTQRHVTVNLLKSKTIRKNTESSKRISTHHIRGTMISILPNLLSETMEARR